MNINIKSIITNTSFVVIGIFLFGVNTSIAAPRPYLPESDKSWPGSNAPLATAVSKIQDKIQKQQAVNNEVIWVDVGSPYFSNSGFSVLNYNTKSPTIFGGLQHADISSNFEQLAAFGELVGKSSMEVYDSIADQAERRLMSKQPGAKPASANVRNISGNSSFNSIDEPLLVEQGQEQQSTPSSNGRDELQNKDNNPSIDHQIAQAIRKNLWLELDS